MFGGNYDGTAYIWYDTNFTMKKGETYSKLVDVIGLQKSIVTTDKYSIRLVGNVEALELKGVAMEVSAVCDDIALNGTWVSTNKQIVYDKLYGRDSEGKTIEILPKSRNLLFVLVIDGLVEGKRYEFTVKPYVELGNEKIYGKPKTFVINSDGTITN